MAELPRGHYSFLALVSAPEKKVINYFSHIIPLPKLGASHIEATPGPCTSVPPHPAPANIYQWALFPLDGYPPSLPSRLVLNYNRVQRRASELKELSQGNELWGVVINSLISLVGFSGGMW